MNGVVGLVCCRDEKLDVEDLWVTAIDVGKRDRVHVMNIRAIMNLVSLNTQITTIVSNEDVPTDMTPLGGSVEHLIHPPVEPERGVAYSPEEREISEPIYKRVNPSELRVGPNLHRLPRLTLALHPCKNASR